MRRLINFFLNIGFKHCDSDHNVYVLHVNSETLIFSLYIDDLVITKSNVDINLDLKKQLVDTFEMTNLGLLHLFLGIQVLHMDDGIFISQPKYVWNILEKFIWKTINHFLCLTNRE
jgi:histone deacetylase 1/2